MIKWTHPDYLMNMNLWMHRINRTKENVAKEEKHLEQNEENQIIRQQQQKCFYSK